MIFVTVGTTDFDDLVRHMDELAPTLGEEVICQIGRGSYLPQHCQFFRFAPSLDDYLQRSRLVVSHGGLGSVMEALRLGKPLIGVSNPDRSDHHQDDVLSTLETGNYILWCRSLRDLATCINRAHETTLTAYIEPPCHIPTVVDQFLHSERIKREVGLFRKLWSRMTAGQTTQNL